MWLVGFAVQLCLQSWIFSPKRLYLVAQIIKKVRWSGHSKYLVCSILKWIIRKKSLYPDEKYFFTTFFLTYFYGIGILCSHLIFSCQGVYQWFLLVLLRQRHHRWTRQEEFLQSHDSGKTDFQQSDWIHSGKQSNQTWGLYMIWFFCSCV